MIFRLQDLTGIKVLDLASKKVSVWPGFGGYLCPFLVAQWQIHGRDRKPT